MTGAGQSINNNKSARSQKPSITEKVNIDTGSGVKSPCLLLSTSIYENLEWGFDVSGGCTLRFGALL